MVSTIGDFYMEFLIKRKNQSRRQSLEHIGISWPPGGTKEKRKLFIKAGAHVPDEWCNATVEPAQEQLNESTNSVPYTQNYIRKLIHEKIDETKPYLGQSGYIGIKLAELQEAIDAHNNTLTLGRQQMHLPTQLAEEVCSTIQGSDVAKAVKVDCRIADNIRDWFALVAVPGSVTAKEQLASDIVKVVVCNTESGHVVRTSCISFILFLFSSHRNVRIRQLLRLDWAYIAFLPWAKVTTKRNRR